MACSVDIVIPVWNQSALTVKCLRSIREHTPEPYRVIVVDNASDPAEFAVVDEELRSHGNVLLIRNTENVGFVKATNRGLCASEAPFVVLMNNDTEAVPGWIARLMEPMSDPRVGAVGPLTTTPESWQGRHARAPGWRVLNTNAMLAFFCTLIRREAIEVVGLLDEDFGIGFGDDDDWCGRLHEAGYRLALVSDLVIPHHHRTSFRTRFQEHEIKIMQDRAMEMFRRKRDARKGKPMARRPSLRDDYPPDIREASRWIAELCRQAKRGPVGVVVECDPWSLATLCILGDLGFPGVKPVMLTQGGKPGGEVTLPGRPVVPAATAEKVCQAALRATLAPPVQHVEVPPGIDPYVVLSEIRSVPVMLLVGRWFEPAPKPSMREAALGRSWVSFTNGIALDVVRRFCLARGLTLPGAFVMEKAGCA